MNVLYVDGGCGPYSGDEAWGSVIKNSTTDVLYPGMFKNSTLGPDMEIKTVNLPRGPRNIIVAKFNDVASQQNNGAELMAMVAGLRIAVGDPSISIIYSDSQLIETYWSRGQVNAKTRAKMDPRKLKFIEECADLRRKFEARGGRIIKISGSQNPADLGYH